MLHKKSDALSRGVNRQGTLHISVVLPMAGHGQLILAGAVRRFNQAKRNWSLRPVDPGSSLLLEELDQWKPDGVMVESSSQRAIEWCQSNGVPYVFLLGGRTSHSEYPLNVGIDDLAVGRMAANYFLDRRYEVFAFVGNGNYAFSLERQEGFKATLQASGKEISSFVHSTPEFDSRPKPRLMYHSAMGEWLNELPKPVALFAGNDWEALAVIQACNDAGIRVPDEVAVLGANDDKLICGLCMPRISSVKLPFAQLGYEAASFLLQATRASGRGLPSGSKLLPPITLISRNSSVDYWVRHPVVREAINYMRSQLEKPFKINNLLKHLNVSRPSLERYFKAELGETPLVTLRKLRIERAKALLSDTLLNNAEIAQRSGFTSNIRFVTVFKKMVGTPPATYRENLRFEELI